MSNPSSSLDFETFGEFLRHLRRSAGLTQRDLSQAVGYSEAQITRLENGQRLPDLAALKGLFVEALDLRREPELSEQLVALAAKARSDG
jgi:transcriptional regulator with XRE-family HTH domain